MESYYLINLISIFAVNVFFFFTGICLNSLVILSFWRSVQLRKKLCYFMIMVLSCCDLFAVLTNNPSMAFISMSWLTEKLDVNAGWPHISLRWTSIFLQFSLFALLVMNFNRYLATSYPIFHRTSVTKGRLLSLLAILIIVEITVRVMSVNNFVISSHVHMLILCILFIPAMLFINYKLLLVVRKSRKNKRISPDMKKTFSLKNLSSCLLVVACVVVVSIATFVYIGLRINSPDTRYTLNNEKLAAMWTQTIASMNCTVNCLIFYWKNKVLRIEGLKVLKSLKICRRVES
jgi:multisubunit Na+/H+ antiporter MnhB subunit